MTTTTTVTLSAEQYEKLKRCRRCRISLMQKYYKPASSIDVKVNGSVVLTFPVEVVEENHQKFGDKQ